MTYEKETHLNQSKLTPKVTKSYHGAMGEREKEVNIRDKEVSIKKGVEQRIDSILGTPEATQALAIYKLIKPEASWTPKDKARINYILAPATDEETRIFRQKHIPFANMSAGAEDYFTEQARIEANYQEVNTKYEKESAQKKIMLRAFQVMFELNKEVDPQTGNLSIAQLKALSNNLYNYQKINPDTNKQLDLSDTTLAIARELHHRHHDQHVNEVDSSAGQQEIISDPKSINVLNKRNVKKENRYGGGIIGGGDGGDNHNGGNGNGGDNGGEGIHGTLIESLQVQKEQLEVQQAMLRELREIKQAQAELVSALTEGKYESPNEERFQKQVEALTKNQIDVERRLNKDAWEKELYNGGVDDVLEERMNRIIFFNKKATDLSYTTADPNEAGISTHEQSKRLLEKRLEKVYNAFAAKGKEAADQAVIDYHNEIRRWATVIKKSSESGKLSNLPPEHFDKIQAFLNVNLDQKPSENLKLAAQEVEKLKSIDFLEYFRTRDDDGKIHKVSYLANINPDPNEKRNEYGLPESREETIKAIARTWGPEGWGIGGEHEIIDAEGKFHLDNFKLWVRTRIVEMSENDPLNAIDPLNNIRIKVGWSDLSILQILSIPQYTQHREFEIKGDASRLGQSDAIRARWSDPVDMDKSLKADIIVEIWRAGFKQTDWTKLNQASCKLSLEEYLKAQYDIFNNNNYTRSGFLLDQDLKLDSIQGNETDNYYKKGEQGSIGKAQADGYLFYRYFTELTEFYAERDSHGKVKGIKDFDKNNAYAALGLDGSSAFLLGVAEGALAYNTQTHEIKEDYRKYLRERVRLIEAKYNEQMRLKYPDERDERNKKAQNKLNELTTIYSQKISEIPVNDITIKMDSSQLLEEYILKLETQALGKKLIRDINKYDADDLSQGVITKEEAKNLSEEYMRAGIGNFLKHVMSHEILTSSGKHEQIGKLKIKLSGNDNNGINKRRIVTDKEWKDLGNTSEMPGQNVLTLSEVAEQFATNYSEDLKFEAEYKKTLQKYKDASDDEMPAIQAEIDGKKQRYFEILTRNEQLAFGLLSKVANISREEFNRFKMLEPKITAEYILKNSLIKSLGKTYGLSNTESRYAYQLVWYTLPQYMITSWNNTSGIPPIDRGTTLVRFMEVRNKHHGGANVASHELLPEFVALMPPTRLDMLRVHHSGDSGKGLSLIEVLEGVEPGGESGMKPRHIRHLERDTKSLVINTEALRNSFITNTVNAAKLVDNLIKNDEMHLQNALAYHPYTGELIVNHEKMTKIFSEWWNVFRNMYNNSEIDYDRQVSVDGMQKSVLEHMFGPNTLKTIEELKSFYESKGLGKGHEAEYYHLVAQKLKEQPALAVFMNLIAIEIKEHRKFGSGFERLSVYEIDKIKYAIKEFLKQSGPVIRGDHSHIGHMPDYVPYGAFYAALLAQDMSMDKEVFTDTFLGLLSGIFFGLFQSLEEAFDEIKQVEKIYKA